MTRGGGTCEAADAGSALTVEVYRFCVERLQSEEHNCAKRQCADSAGLVGRSSALGRRGRLLHSTRFSQRAAEEEFDLRVEAAQIVIRPPLHRFEQLGIDAKKKSLPLRHVSSKFKVQSECKGARFTTR